MPQFEIGYEASEDQGKTWTNRIVVATINIPETSVSKQFKRKLDDVIILLSCESDRHIRHSWSMQQIGC